ncbi:MAG: hypothetical protein HY331_17605 [Chloroflexi bacterium]|nr:hypothetical protein [Chloroflexota bacterium]
MPQETPGAVKFVRDVMIPMPDGVRLAGNLYLPDTGEPVGQHTRAMVAENVIYHDAEHPSHVVLPIVPA